MRTVQMKIYNDEQNAKGIYMIFVVVQMSLLILMYSIVYASYRATELSVEKYHLNAFTAFAPTLIIFIAIPLTLHKTRILFRKGRMMFATMWMMALMALFFVGLMLHIMKISATPW